MLPNVMLTFTLGGIVVLITQIREISMKVMMLLVQSKATNN